MTATTLSENNLSSGTIHALIAPVEEAREAVRRHALRLAQNFEDLTVRLPESVLLQDALRNLEHEAALCDYEPLSRIAAVLHDVLRYNPIDAFDSAMLPGFVEALQQATEGRADQADPFACELALYKGGLDWLPPMPSCEGNGETKAADSDEE